MDIREPQLRIALVTLGSVLLLLLTVVLAYQLVAARVPQQRAALEQLIRHETGLEVRFSELSVRWAWRGQCAAARAAADCWARRVAHRAQWRARRRAHQAAGPRHRSRPQRCRPRCGSGTCTVAARRRARRRPADPRALA